jgi:hypothetical protein
MNASAILALFDAVIANAPALSADLQTIIKTLTSLIEGNPGATAAQVQAQITSALADAAAADQAVEGA